MTKAEFIERYAEKYKVTQKSTREVLDNVLEFLTEVFVEGESVSFSNFGTLGVIRKKERVGTNPQTLEKIVIPATNAITFKTGKGLKKIVNE